MTSIKILPDSHLGRAFINNVPLNRRGERERTLWQKFEQALDPHGAEVHVHVGDIFNAAIVPNAVVARAADLYCMAASCNPKTQFVVLRGNHDASRDLEAVSSFDIFRAIVGNRYPNLSVITEGMVLHPDNEPSLVFFPWDPIHSADELVRQNPWRADGATAFGHWDTDLRSDPFNLIPTKLLAEQGFKKAYTGHVHLKDRFERDGIDVEGVGSLIPFAHGEDADGTTYVTLSLEQAHNADPEELRNKCVRIRLAEGEVYDLNIDCLQLQVERGAVSTEPLDVSLGDFDLHQLFDDVLEDHGVPSFIASEVRSEWDRIFTLGR